jgi:hypothetical protein
MPTTKTRSATTTIQVKRYVVEKVRERIGERGNLSYLTEKLLNAWLSGSNDILRKVEV